jgi:hypothetical protein
MADHGTSPAHSSSTDDPLPAHASHTPGADPDLGEQRGAILGVEIGGLADFAAFLDQELRANFSPTVDAIRTDSSHGLNWGTRLRSGLIDAARTTYVRSQEEALANLSGYLGAGAAMRDLIQRLMETYRTSDEMAGLTTQDVLDLFAQVRVERSAAIRHQVLEYLRSHTGA